MSTLRAQFLVALPSLLVALLSVAAVSADQYYQMKDWKVWSNTTLYDLNKEGTLTGVHAGIYANKSDDDIDFHVLFVNSTPDSFTLSILAINWNEELSGNLQGKVVWTANPGRPVRWGSKLECNSGGNLELTDTDGTRVWSTDTYGAGVTRLWMTDMGNMLLLTENHDVKWQSFDFLTNSLAFRRILKPEKKLTSSVSETNRSQGSYHLQVKSNNLVLYYSSKSKQEETYWALWNAPTASNTYVFAALCAKGLMNFLKLGTNFSAFDQTNMALSSDCNTIQPVAELYVGNSSAAATFLFLQPDGNLQVIAWNSETSTWEVMFSLFNETSSCQLPRKCGPFRICGEGICGDCPAGFVDVDPAVKELGCRQSQPSNTCINDTYQELKGYQYFASSFTEKSNNNTPEDCLGKCVQSCSCQASFFQRDNSGNSYCYITDDVGTIQKVGSENSTSRAYLRMHAQIEGADKPPQAEKKSKVPEIVGGTVGALAGLVLLVLIVLGILKNKKAAEVSDSDKDQEETMLELSMMSSLPTKYSSKDLHTITNGYSRKLGAGGFGVVYQGVLEDGVQVAVKKLDEGGSSQHRKQFYAEVEVLAKAKHWNLVQLVGFSTKRTLVYEFMENGSLDTWLFDDEKRTALTWEVRMKIALGTARGLAYLHEDCSEKIIHLDLKPQNILLDAEFNAKIGDFGLSKPMDRQQSYVMTTMKGTPGYLAPEWLVEGVITEKVDVFSYGVVLMELVAGCKYKALSTDSERSELLRSAFRSADSAMEFVVDRSLLDVNMEEAHRAVRVALLCLQKDPVQRPSMSKVVHMLQGVLPIPVLLDDESFSGSTLPVFTSLMKAILEGGSTSGSSSSAFLRSSSQSLFSDK